MDLLDNLHSGVMVVNIFNPAFLMRIVVEWIDKKSFIERVVIKNACGVNWVTFKFEQ